MRNIGIETKGALSAMQVLIHEHQMRRTTEKEINNWKYNLNSRFVNETECSANGAGAKLFISADDPTKFHIEKAYTYVSNYND